MSDEEKPIDQWMREDFEPNKRIAELEAHKVIAGYSHTLGLQERDQRIAELEAEVEQLKAERDKLELRLLAHRKGLVTF